MHNVLRVKRLIASKKTIDVLSLARTRSGDFSGACALDFYDAGQVRGLDATRDADGGGALSRKWPFFGSKASKKALIAKDDIPVRSCFGGMCKS